MINYYYVKNLLTKKQTPVYQCRNNNYKNYRNDHSRIDGKSIIHTDSIPDMFFYFYKGRESTIFDIMKKNYYHKKRTQNDII